MFLQVRYMLERRRTCLDATNAYRNDRNADNRMRPSPNSPIKTSAMRAYLENLVIMAYPEIATIIATGSNVRRCASVNSLRRPRQHRGHARSVRDAAPDRLPCAG